MRIFPIPARGEQRVQVTYYQELDVDHDWATYVYPLATTADNGRIDAANHRPVRVHARREERSADRRDGEPVARRQTSSIAKHDASHYWQASLEADGGDLEPRRRARLPPGAPADRRRPHHLEAGRRRRLLHAHAHRRQGAGEARSRAWTTSSCSTSRAAWRSTASSARRARSIEAFIEALGPEDRFEVMTFNVQPNLLFGELKPADEAGHKAAAEFLDSQQARGGTVLQPALQTRLQVSRRRSPAERRAALRRHDRAERARAVARADRHRARPARGCSASASATK